jgi:diguanylate cyclase (GGDEF)-like protein
LRSSAGQQQQRIDYLAYYDILTGLPNRRLFYERLDQALAVRDAARVALLTFDVERFKTINETFSLAAGDRVLQHFAQRLVAFARDRFVLGRVGANEFALLMPRVGDSGEVGRMLARKRAAARFDHRVRRPRGEDRRTRRSRDVPPTTAGTPIRCCATRKPRCARRRRAASATSSMRRR